MRFSSALVFTLASLFTSLAEAHCLTGRTRAQEGGSHYEGDGWCAGKRFIGLLLPGHSACPEDVNWQVAPLFDLQPQLAVPFANRPYWPTASTPDSGARPTPARLRQMAREVGLDRYCVYLPRVPGIRPPPSLRRQLERIDPDFCGVAPASLDLVALNGPGLHQLALQAVQPPPEGVVRGQVRLAIVDTLPTGKEPSRAPTQLCSRHGDSLFRLAAELACRRQGDCPVTFTSRLAMGTNETGTKSSCEGGRLGYLGDIGAAVFDEIVSWSQEATEDRLVLNLSLGWNGHSFGGLESEQDMPAPAQAVYRSLELARRAGAMVFAAAGNATPGPTSKPGPLLPAGWERRESPPVVYAVSGLTAKGKPVPNSRPGAQARRSTFGGPASVSFDTSAGRTPPQYTPALTGTSVAAAVTSALAAAHWARRPDDRPARLVRRLEHDGERLEWRSDSDLDRFRRRTRHVLIGKGDETNDSRPSSNVEKPLEITVDSVQKKPFAPIHDSILEQPLASPQPGADPCPPCMIDPPRTSVRATGEAVLRIELDPAWDWDQLCVKLDALQLNTVSSAQTTHKFSESTPCWPENPAAPVLSYSAPVQVGPEPIDEALLYWVVVERNSEKRWSTLSTPLVGSR